jgi:hypothetical protein
MKQILSEEFRGMIYFISESIQAFIVYIFGIAATWLWLPYIVPVKMLITMLIALNFYNIAKHFIYIRFALWKETLNVPKKSKYDGLNKP